MRGSMFLCKKFLMIVALVLMGNPALLGQEVGDGFSESGLEKQSKKTKAKTKRKPEVQTNKKKIERTKANQRMAEVRVNSAMCYLKPDLDSRVLRYLDLYEVYPVVREEGGFYYLRIETGDEEDFWDASEDSAKSGCFIEAADVKLRAKVAEVLAGEDEDSQDTEAKRQRSSFAKSFFHRRHMTVGGSSLEFRGESHGDFFKSKLAAFDLNIRGADLLVEGAVVSKIGLLFSQEVPHYFEAVSGQDNHKGYLLLLDASLLSPIVASPRQVVYGSFGPLIRFSSWDVLAGPGQKLYKIEELNLGLSFGFAWSLSFTERVALTLSWQYFWERYQHSQLGMGLSIALE